MVTNKNHVFDITLRVNSHENDKSVCETGDQSMLTNIVKDVFLDSPSNCKYNFNLNPPILDGQNGVPLIVDELLGKSIVQPTQFSMSYF